MDTPKFTLTDDDIVTIYLSPATTKISEITPSNEKQLEENDVYDGSDDDGDNA